MTTTSRETVIEGSVREVALADVLQLLDLGKKSGVLHVIDGVGARSARVWLVNGRIANAELVPPRPNAAAREVVIELLGWTSGRFSVESSEHAPRARLATFAVDSVLMEAAQRADEWARLADRLGGPDDVPRLASPNGLASAPLALAPDEWEVLAFADGSADLRTLAVRTNRELLTVARAVHRLVGEGFLAIGVPTDDSRSSTE